MITGNFLTGKQVRVFTIDDKTARYAYSGPATLEALNEYYIIVTVDKGGEDEFVEVIPMHHITSIDTLIPLDEETPLGIDATKVAIGGDSAYCFVTGEFIGADVIDAGKARFAVEFDAWVSEEGQRILKDEQSFCSKIILREWEEQD